MITALCRERFDERFGVGELLFELRILPLVRRDGLLHRELDRRQWILDLVRESARDILPCADALEVLDLCRLLLEVVEHRVERAAELGHLVGAEQLDAGIDVTIRHAARGSHERLDPARHDRGHEDAEDRNRRADTGDYKNDPTESALRRLPVRGHKRDNNENTLDGGKSYKLTVPQPVPGKLFWSVTVYDTDTRSQINTDQGKAALRSLFELKNASATTPTELYFGPQAPSGHENAWIKTIPGKGWFVYFRVYGPEQSAFDGSWKPSDFEEVK